MCVCCRKTWDLVGPEYGYDYCEDCYMHHAYFGECEHKEE